jgi:D-alanyl-D-alanine dipeptidase
VTSNSPTLVEPNARPEPIAQPTPRRNAAALDPQSFINLRSIAPDILLDMRYAGENNFAKRKVYPEARCLLRAPVAEALLRVQTRLRPQGFQLWIWDCYRPFHVQEEFWKLVPDSKYVAKPIRRDGKPWRGSKHNRGAAVDLSLADANGTQVSMPTDHDDFSKRAHRGAKGIPEAAAGHARILDEAMRAEGFQGIQTEWWHYDHAGWQSYELSDEGL